MNAVSAVRMPSAAEILDTLPDIAEGLQAQLIELHKRPSPDRCDRLLANLSGASRTLRTLQAALQREGSGDVR